MSEMMMSEKAARAVAEADCGYADCWRDYTPHVRATLLAMREPSDKGLEAFARAFNWNWKTHEGRQNARCAWQAMIDATLTE
jgi:hypothetical protein